MNLPLLRMYPIYPGQWGVSGSDNELGIRSLPQSTVLAEAEVGDNGITIAIPAA